MKSAFHITITLVCQVAKVGIFGLFILGEPMLRFATPFAFALCTLLVGPSVTTAQRAAVRPDAIPSTGAISWPKPGHTIAPLPMHHIDDVVRDVRSVATSNRLPKVVDAMTQEAAPGILVGKTYYDFQTNGAMANRLSFFEDGGEKYVQMLWMVSEDPTREAATGALGANPARGSFYSYIDVSNPSEPILGIDKWKRIEPDRAGWPSIVQFSDGSVGTPSHVPVRFWRNGSVGDEVFVGGVVPSSGDEKLWPRAAVGNDDVIHLIYSSRSADNTISQVYYRRSTDFGENWEPEIQFTGASGLGSSQTSPLYNSLGGDTYAVAARGDTVAVLYLDNPVRQLWLRLSTDNGATWPLESTRVLFGPQWKEIDSTTYTTDGIDSVLVKTDTALTPGNDIDVIIDSKGVVHYTFSEHYSSVEWRRQADQTNRSGTIFTDMVTDQSFVGAGMWYGNTGDNMVYKMAPVGGAEGWDGVGKFVNRRFYSGGSRFPQFGIDAQDNLYMTYSSCKSGDFEPVEIDTTPTFTQGETDTLSTVDGLFGHVFITHKLAGYPAWSAPVDLTPEGRNCLFPTMADNVLDGQMYIAYSHNETPGDHVTNTELPEEFTSINFMAVPTSRLNVINSIDEDRDVLESAVRVSPNPANENVTVRFDGINASHVTLSIISSLGQTMMTSTSPAGQVAHGVTIATQELPTGTYLVVVEAGGQRASRTLSIVR